MRRALLLPVLAIAAVRLLQAQEPAVLMGRVVEAAGGAPVAGAEVAVLPERVAILSDADGRWRLRADGSGPFRVRVRRLGYVMREVAVAPGAPVTILLEPLPVALEAVVVTAARREQKLKDAVPETELITRRDIEEAGASDVGRALTQATGIQLEGGVPAGAGVFLQGLGSQRVLVLLDGQPLTGRLNGNFDLSRLPTSMVERIEVVRGPQSTLYGSDAMGGVVNVITREPAGRLSGSMAFLGGTQGRREVTATALGTSGRAGFVADGGWRREDLAPGRAGDDGTGASRWNVAPKLRWELDPGTGLEISGLVVGERQRYRTGQLFHFSDNTQWAARAALVRRHGLRRLAPSISYSRFEHLSRAATGSTPASDSGQSDAQELLQAEIGYSAPVPAGGLADVGVLVRRDAIRADRVSGGERALLGVEAYGQATWQFGGLSATPGVRFSRHERWGDALTPRLALLLRPSAAVALRASFGAGYRAPDFKELYYDFVNAAAGYAVKGNPDLRPERSTSISMSAEVVGDRFFGRASVYANRFHDFIEYGPPDASGTYTLGNLARGTISGIEVEGGWAAGGVRVEAGYAGLRARDDVTGAPMLGRTAHSGRLSAAAPAGPIRLAATMTVTGRTPIRADAAGAIVEWRSTFARLDLRGAFAVAGSVEAALGVENLLDRRLDGEWPGFTGRRLSAGIVWRGGA